MKTNYLIIISLLSLASCQPSLHYPTDSDNSKNLNSLLTLKLGVDTVYLQDFILNPSDIDSVTSSSKVMKCSVSADKMTARLTVPNNMETFADLKLWVKGIPYSVPCRKTDKIDYTFIFNPHGKTYQHVQIAGQMNDWVPSLSPDLKLNTNGLYQVTLNLSPGSYMYQLVLDTAQNADPNNPDKVDNGYGKFNSILQIAGNDDRYPKIYTDKFNNKTIKLITLNDVKKVFVYWQNFLLPTNFIDVDEGEIYFKIPI
jgi:hypothetical protein